MLWSGSYRLLPTVLTQCNVIGCEEAEQYLIGLVKTKTNTQVPPTAWEIT